MTTEENPPFEQYPSSVPLLDAKSVLSRILAHAQQHQPHTVAKGRDVVKCLWVIAQDLEKRALGCFLDCFTGFVYRNWAEESKQVERDYALVDHDST